ncbi:MAG: hypothetical protein H8D31_00025 [Nitrosopumilus sp.]|nr:hypothetical protein [Nitrosopumilus sp.]
MTKKIDFEEKWNKLAHIIHESSRKKVLDVILMSELGFSPSSWKVWKPKFIEKASCKVIPILDENQENIVSTAMVEYNKKKKWWEFNECSEQIESKIGKVFS